MAIKIIIIDDEQEALENLRLLLSSQKDCQLLEACDNGISGLKSIIEKKPDLVFLDIQMPELSGFDVIKAVRPFHNPIYIFTTAYDQYAVNAFTVNALDYLLKPFDDTRFLLALEKAKKHYQLKSSFTYKIDALLEKLDKQATSTYITRIPIKSPHHVFFIEVKNIIHFMAENQYVNVFLVSGEQHLIRDSLNHLETVLDPQVFFRSNRSDIININEIESIKPHFRGNSTIVLKNGKKVKLSKTKKEYLKRIMNW